MVTAIEHVNRVDQGFTIRIDCSGLVTINRGDLCTVTAECRNFQIIGGLLSRLGVLVSTACVSTQKSPGTDQPLVRASLIKTEILLNEI